MCHVRGLYYCLLVLCVQYVIYVQIIYIIETVAVRGTFLPKSNFLLGPIKLISSYLKGITIKMDSLKWNTYRARLITIDKAKSAVEGENPEK